MDITGNADVYSSTEFRRQLISNFLDRTKVMYRIGERSTAYIAL